MFLGMQITSELSIPFYTSEVWWMTDREAGARRNSVLNGTLFTGAEIWKYAGP